MTAKLIVAYAIRITGWTVAVGFVLMSVTVMLYGIAHEVGWPAVLWSFGIAFGLIALLSALNWANDVIINQVTPPKPEHWD